MSLIKEGSEAHGCGISVSRPFWTCDLALAFFWTGAVASVCFMSCGVVWSLVAGESECLTCSWASEFGEESYAGKSTISLDESNHSTCQLNSPAIAVDDTSSNKVDEKNESSLEGESNTPTWDKR